MLPINFCADRIAPWVQSSEKGQRTLLDGELGGGCEEFGSGKLGELPDILIGPQHMLVFLGFYCLLKRNCWQKLFCDLASFAKSNVKVNLIALNC